MTNGKPGGTIQKYLPLIDTVLIYGLIQCVPFILRAPQAGDPLKSSDPIDLLRETFSESISHCVSSLTNHWIH
jgi:hypothetical protein